MERGQIAHTRIVLRRFVFGANGQARRSTHIILVLWGLGEPEKERKRRLWSCFGVKEVLRGWILFRGWPPVGRDFHCPLSPPPPTPAHTHIELSLASAAFATHARSLSGIYLFRLSAFSQANSWPTNIRLSSRSARMQKRKFMYAFWLLRANPNAAWFMGR